MGARIPVQVVEIDQPTCANVYGVSPCTASGSEKCYNTLKTCQDAGNYDGSAITTLTFCNKDAHFGGNIIPSVQSTKTQPTTINVGSRSYTMKPLGKRGSCDVALKDHPYSDNLTDPYLNDRNFKPLERGTFWSKWLARNPYYEGMELRIKEGYSDESIASMQTQHYVIDTISFDSNDNVRISGLDRLIATDNDKAQVPELSSGRLLNAITETQDSITITGGTLAEYTKYNTNKIRIGSETISYLVITQEADGDLTFTGCERGIGLDEAATHSEKSNVQACIEWSNVKPYEIAYELLNVHAGVPASKIGDFTTDGEIWHDGFFVSRLITKPTGISTLLGELSEQASFYVWHDAREDLIKFRVIKPRLGVTPIITEAKNVIQNTISASPVPALRASEVWVSYLPFSSVDDSKKLEKYDQTLAVIDELFDSRGYNRKVLNIYSHWITSSSDAQLLAFRLLERYKNPPVFVKFKLDVKDRWLGVGDIFDLEYRGLVDFSGLPKLTRYQVISIHESVPGEVIDVEAQSFEFEDDYRFGGWMAESANDYATATEQEKISGCFWGAEDGTVDGTDLAYSWA